MDFCKVTLESIKYLINHILTFETYIVETRVYLYLVIKEPFLLKYLHQIHVTFHKNVKCLPIFSYVSLCDEAKEFIPMANAISTEYVTYFNALLVQDHDVFKIRIVMFQTITAIIWSQTRGFLEL